MLCLSSLPSLVSRDLFLMQFQVSADSLCCGALAVHRALPGPRTAWQRTFGDGVLHALLTEEPGSQGNLEAVLHSSLLAQAVAQPGFPGVHGKGEGHGCTCSDADFSHHHWGYPCSLWNKLSSLLELCDHHPWHRAALERQCAHPQEEGLWTIKRKKKKTQHSPTLKKWRAPTPPPPFTLLVSSSLKNSSLKIFSRKPIATKSETFLPRCSQTGGCMDVWKLDYTSLYKPQCPLTPKLAASSTAAPEQRYVMLRGWGTEHGGDVCDRVCCCPGVKCPMQPVKSMQPLKEWARARCSVLGAGKSPVPTPEQRQRVPVIPLRDLPWTELGLPRSVSCCHPRWGLLRDLAPPAAAAGAGGEGLWWKAPSRGVRTLFNTDVLCTANQTHEPKCDQCLVSLKTKGYLGAVSAVRIFSDPGQDKTCCFL